MEMFCWLYRVWISHVLDGERVLPGSLKEHIRTCDSCRRFYQTSLMMADRLKQEAPGGMFNRLFVDLTGQALPLSQGRQRRSLRPWRAAAAVFVVVLAGGVIYWGVSTTLPQPAPKNELQSFTETLYEHGFAADTFTGRTDGSLQTLAAGPFQQEMSRITEDANRALDFLVVSLVQSDPQNPNKKPGT